MFALSQLLEKWKEWLSAQRAVSLHTIKAYESDLQHFFKFLQVYQGAEPTLDSLTSLTPADIRAWLSMRLQVKISQRSNARALSAVRNFFSYLERQSLATTAVIKKIQSPRIRSSLPRPLEQSQVVSVLATFDEEVEKAPWVRARDLALFTLLYAGGLRLAEALSLTPADIRNPLLIKGKGKKERMVPLLKVAKERLKKYQNLCPYPLVKDQPLFLGVRGQVLNPAIAQRQMRAIRRSLNLGDSATPHALRHSFATHLMQEKSDLRSIQELLGHASLATTQTYTKLVDAELMQVHKRTHPRNLPLSTERS